MGNNRSRSSGSIFDDDEKELIYKLPLNHDKYYFVAIYRRRGENNFKHVMDIKLLDPAIGNYPFNRLIENSVLPYVGDDSKERLMRKHSKATMLSSSNSLTSTNPLDQNNGNNTIIYDPMHSSLEEYHSTHPNSDSSTINIDVVYMRKSGDESSFPSLALIGAVCDVVSKEKRREFMLKLRDICVDVLNNQSSNPIDTIEKEDEALKGITDSVLRLTNSGGSGVMTTESKSYD